MILCPAIAMTGLYLSSLTKKRIRLLRTLALFFAETERLCKGGAYSVSEIFIILKKRKQFSELSFLEYIAESFFDGENLKSIWLEAVDNFCKSFCDNACKEALLSFSDGFGKENRENFCERCRSFSDFFAEKAEELSLHWEKSREMTVYSGILCAVAVFFIFV